MKRMTMVVVGAMLISAVGMYAQAKPAATTDQKTITGCVVPGSNNDSFKLVNGKQKGQKGNETATYGLVPENKDVDIRRFQTMEVEVTGTVAGATDKMVVTVSKIKRRSDYCG